MSSLRRHWDADRKRFFYTALFARFVAHFELDPESRSWVAVIKSRVSGFTEHVVSRDLFTQRDFHSLDLLHAHVIEWVGDNA